MKRFFACVFFLTGCAGTYNQTVSFNPSEPLRVAVLPFVAVDKDGKVMQEEGRLIVDTLSVVSSEQKENPAQTVRRQVLTELQHTGLDIVSPAMIDVDLPHRGFGRSDGTLDIEKVRATSPKELCEKFLDCDAVLYGEVTKWDRTYLAIQTINVVGIHLKLVSARDNKVLFESASNDSESRGLTKGPTGISSLILEPIKGLDSDIIVDLARSVVQKTLAPLRQDNRPEYLQSGPPVIFAASHDAQSGTLVHGKPLIVVAYASEHQNAVFSIGNEVASVPMFEKTPGHYYGEFYPISSDSFNAQQVKVSVTDTVGRTTTYDVHEPPLTLTKK